MSFYEGNLLKCHIHMKDCILFCPKHLNTVCCLCSQNHRYCHLIPMDVVDRNFYAPILQNLYKSTEDLLDRFEKQLEKTEERFQPEIAGRKQNQNQKSVLQENKSQNIENKIPCTIHGTVIKEEEQQCRINLGNQAGPTLPDVTGKQLTNCKPDYLSAEEHNIDIKVVDSVNKHGNVKSNAATNKTYYSIIGTFISVFKRQLLEIKELQSKKEQIACVMVLKELMKYLTNRTKEKNMKYRNDLVLMEEFVCVFNQLIPVFVNNTVNKFYSAVLTTSCHVAEQVKLKIVIPKGNKAVQVNSCFFLSNIIVFLDIGNSCLALFNENGSFLRKIELYGKPWDAAPAGSYRVVVRYLNWDWFEVLDLTDCNHVTSKMLRKISFRNELVYSSSGSCCLNVYRPNGSVIAAVTDVEENIFTRVATDTKNIYYISSDKKCVCSKRKGSQIDHVDTVTKYEVGGKIHSITATGNGFIFVSSTDNKVLALDMDNKIRHNVTLDLKEGKDGLLMSLCYEQRSGRLLICNGGDLATVLVDALPES